jgi:TP901 family phage tail tape measure protein
MAKKTVASHKLEFLLTGKNLTKKAFTQVTSALKSMTKIAANAGKSIVIGFAGVGAAVTAMLADFAPFETALVDLKQVSGATLDSLEKRLFALDPALGNLTDLTKGLFQVFSAGITDTASAFTVLEASAKAAVAGHVDLEQTVLAVTKTMKGFGDQVRGPADATDFLFKIVEKGQTTLEQLTSVVGGLGRVSTDLGLSMEEVGGSLAELTLFTGDVSEANTQLLGIMNALLKPNEDMKQILKELGFATGQAIIETHGFVGALKLVRDQSELVRRSISEVAVETDNLEDGMDKTKKVVEDTVIGFSSAIGRVRSFKGALALLADGAIETELKISSMNDRFGKTQKQFDAVSKTISQLWQTFKNTLGLIAKRITTSIAPDIEFALDVINQALLKNADLIVDFFTDLWKAFKDLLPTWDQTKKFVTDLIERFKKLKKENEGLGTTIKTFLIENIKRGVTALIDIAKALNDATPSVKIMWTEVKILGGWLKEVATKDGKIFQDWLTEIYNTDGPLIIGMLKDITFGTDEWNLSMVRALAQGNASLTLWLTIVDIARAIAKAWAKAAASLAEFSDDLKAWGKDLKANAVEWGKGMIDGFIEGIDSKIDAAVDVINKLMKRLRKFFTSSPAEEGPFKDLNDTGPGLVKTFAEGITRSTNIAVDAVSAMVVAMDRELNKGIGGAMQLNRELTEGITTKITVDSKSALQDVNTYKAALTETPEEKTTTVNVRLAGDAANIKTVKSLIDSIPRVIVKRVEFSGAREMISALTEILSKIRRVPREISSFINIVVGPAIQAVNDLQRRLFAFPDRWVFELLVDTKQALVEVEKIIDLLDSIPDEVIKKVNIQYFLEASPRLPFSEGFRKLVDKMQSLPSDSDFTVHARRNGIGQVSRQDPATTPVVINTVINIEGSGKDGKELAKEIDREQGLLILANRSNTHRALIQKGFWQGGLGGRPIR